MKNNIVDLDERRPHVMIPLPKRTKDEVKTFHVVPVFTFKQIIKEEIPITDLEDWERIIPVIISDWLKGAKADANIYK